jgi:hypothetical protein
MPRVRGRSSPARLAFAVLGLCTVALSSLPSMVSSLPTLEASMSEQTKLDAESEMGEWRTILDHVDALYPIFGERGYSRGDCLNAWILREIMGVIPGDDEDEDEE